MKKVVLFLLAASSSMASAFATEGVANAVLFTSCNNQTLAPIGRAYSERHPEVLTPSGLSFTPDCIDAAIHACSISANISNKDTMGEIRDLMMINLRCIGIGSNPDYKNLPVGAPIDLKLPVNPRRIEVPTKRFSPNQNPNGVPVLPPSGMRLLPQLDPNTFKNLPKPEQRYPLNFIIPIGGMLTPFVVPPESNYWPFFNEVARLTTDVAISPMVRNSILIIIGVALVAAGVELITIIGSWLSIPTLAGAAALIIGICALNHIPVNKDALKLKDNDYSLIRVEKKRIGPNSYLFSVKNGESIQLQLETDRNGVAIIKNKDACFRSDAKGITKMATAVNTKV